MNEKEASSIILAIFDYNENINKFDGFQDIINKFMDWENAESRIINSINHRLENRTITCDESKEFYSMVIKATEIKNSKTIYKLKQIKYAKQQNESLIKLKQIKLDFDRVIYLNKNLTKQQIEELKFIKKLYDNFYTNNIK